MKERISRIIEYFRNNLGNARKTRKLELGKDLKESGAQLLPQSDIEHQNPLDDCEDDVGSEGEAHKPHPSKQTKSAKKEYFKSTRFYGKRWVMEDVVTFEPVVEHDIGMLGSALHYCLGMTPSSSIQAQSTESRSKKIPVNSELPSSSIQAQSKERMKKYKEGEITVTKNREGEITVTP